jgi:hypothetical protein
MVLPTRTCVLNPVDINLNFIDCPDYPVSTDGPYSANFVGFQYGGAAQSLGGMGGNGNVFLFMSAQNNVTIAPQGIETLVGFHLYGFDGTDYLKFDAGVSNWHNFNENNYFSVLVDKQINTTFFYDGGLVLGSVYKAWYYKFPLPDGFTGGEVAGALPATHTQNIDFLNGTVDYFPYYNTSVPLPSSTEADPTSGMLVMAQFTIDTLGLNNSFLVIKQNNAGLTLRAAFTMDDGYTPDYSMNIKANVFDGSYNYTWTQRGPYYNYTVYKWVDSDYGVPSDFEGWRFEFDTDLLNGVVFDHSSAYINEISGTRNGFLMSYWDPDNDEFGAVLIAPDFSSYQQLIMTSSDPKSSNILALASDSYGAYPSLMATPDGLKYYLVNTKAPPNPTINMGIATLSAPPSTTGPIIANPYLYRLPCFTPCTPHAINQIKGVN